MSPCLALHYTRATLYVCFRKIGGGAVINQPATFGGGGTTTAWDCGRIMLAVVEELPRGALGIGRRWMCCVGILKSVTGLCRGEGGGREAETSGGKLLAPPVANKAAPFPPRGDDRALPALSRNLGRLRILEFFLRDSYAVEPPPAPLFLPSSTHTLALPFLPPHPVAPRPTSGVSTYPNSFPIA